MGERSWGWQFKLMGLGRSSGLILSMIVVRAVSPVAARSNHEKFAPPTPHS
jgi:hypothetical protein